MSTTVSVNTYAHTATYIADKILLSLKEIVRESGLSPSHLSTSWRDLEQGVAFWMKSRHLTGITLEIYSRTTDKLTTRWDLEVNYDSSSGGEGTFWTDTALIRYSIAKVGLDPANCGYRFLISTSLGAPDLSGWSDSTFRSTENFTRYSVGAQIGAPGASVETSYWVSK